jgi:imidazolonepropionase-like amidohydrolase
MRRALLLTLAVAVLTLVAAGSALGIAYWAMARRFIAGDAHALDGIVRAPVNEPLVLRNVSLWDGRGGPVQRGRSVVVTDGRVASILDAASPLPAGVRTVDGSGKTLIPGLIDAHVHLMYDSGPDLLTRAPKLMDEWLAITRRYPESREPIVRRGQLKLKAGVTTMRVLGDGYYSLAYRDDLARWDLVGPRVLTAGLHVNGPNGYVSGGLGAHLDNAARAEVAVELRSEDEIERRLEDHIARGVDVIKIATTHGDLGFQDATPDLPEAWVREIVRVAHEHGLKVTAHSYGTEGDWAAVRGGVDGIEHLVNVPHELPDDLVQAIKARGIDVCPTILRMATSNAATALGINDRVGTIEPGKLGDLVLLDGDPVSDIEALERVALVLKEGRIVYRRDPNAGQFE